MLAQQLLLVGNIDKNRVVCIEIVHGDIWQPCAGSAKPGWPRNLDSGGHTAAKPSLSETSFPERLQGLHNGCVPTQTRNDFVYRLRFFGLPLRPGGAILLPHYIIIMTKPI